MNDTASPAASTPSEDSAQAVKETTPPQKRVAISRYKFSFLRWWLEDVVGTVDQNSVIEKRREDCQLSHRYLFMTAMSGGIAILGLLLSSPAVVIGAMLLSPLMGPIMGLGFALAIGDYNWLKQSARSLAWGSAMAVGLCTLVVFFSPLEDITPEIASRTRPNLFDLLVALFSALAGAYAMIRGREGTIVGVAIATALMPPLAVVGFGLATLNWTVFSGALLLYVTNLLTIALTALAMARLYGFRTNMSGRNTLFQNLAVGAVFIALAVPLGLSLRQIAWEANAGRIIRAELNAAFEDSARISQPEIAFDNEPITVVAFAWTTQIKDDAEADAERRLENTLKVPVDLELTQFLVNDERSAVQAQIAAAQAREEAAASDRVDDLTQRLMLAAGVDESEVLIDTRRRRAVVRAQKLEGASLSSYRALEQRIAGSEPDWQVELIPPAATISNIVTFAEGEPDEAGAATIALVGWAATRLDRPVRLSGPREQIARASEILGGMGVEVQTSAARGEVRTSWGVFEN